MMIFVVPKLLEIFENKDALPVTTKALIYISDFLIHY
jgi:type II secretory pathway component PulF